MDIPAFDETKTFGVLSRAGTIVECWVIYLSVAQHSLPPNG